MSAKEQQRSIDTKKALLDAALSEFANAGFDGASLRKIGELAGVNYRLIQHHFGGKLDLWKAVARFALEKFNVRIRARLKGLEGVNEVETLRLIFREFILHSAQEPELNKFMLQANQEPSRMRWLVDTFILPSFYSDLSGITRGQELGIFPKGSAQHLRYIFVGAATSIFAFHEEFHQVTGKDPFEPKIVDEHVDIVMGLFLPR